MPLDAASGVFYGVHGRGRPLLIGLPLMASFTSLFGEELRPVLDGCLSRLTDRYQVLLVDYPSIGGSQDIAPEALTADRVCAALLAVAHGCTTPPPARRWPASAWPGTLSNCRR